MSRIQVFNHVFRQPAHQSQIDKYQGILPYGENNSFPLRLAELVQKSPTAAAGISVLSDSIEGAGFSDPNLKDLVVNSKGLKFGMLHSETCESFALFRGFAWLIKYNAMGDITEIFPVPFENCRLAPPDSSGVISKILVNPYFGTALVENKDTKTYDSFTPDKAVTISQMNRDKTKFKGQILYYGTTRPLSRFYPEPEYYSAKSWMAIDAGIAEYHETNLLAGFFQTVLLKMVGDPDAPSTHPDDQGQDSAGNSIPIRTRGQRFEINMQQFTGADSKTKMIVLWEQLKEQMPELQAFPTITNDNFFTNLQETCDRKILTAIKIPGILVNMGRDNSLSDGSQMANATKVMHDRVAKPQNVLESFYAQILGMMRNPYTGEVKIINVNSFQDMKTIDPSIWEALTPEEKRQWIKDNTEYPILGAAPLAPVNKFMNILFTDYPETVKKTAARALQHANDNPGCGKPMGKKMAQDIIDGKPLSFADVKRIYGYLKKNREHANKLFSDSCESVLFSMWGGMAMFDYCASKISMIND